MNRTLWAALRSLGLNILFCGYYLLLGMLSSSWWLLTLGTYHLILSIVRFVVLLTPKRQNVTRKWAGISLLFLSVPLAGTVILAVAKDRGQVFHEIMMIAIAVYAFSKITLAIINFAKSYRRTSARVVTLRSLSLADAFVSIFALQRSMLVSFGSMSNAETVLFNLLTGTGVWIIVLILAIHLIRCSHRT